MCWLGTVDTRHSFHTYYTALAGSDNIMWDKKITCTSIHYVEWYKKSSSACTDGIPQKQLNDTRIHSHHPCTLLHFSSQATCVLLLDTILYTNT